MVLKEDMTNVFSTAIAEISLRRDIYANVVKVAANRESSMHKEPEKGLSFIRGIGSPHHLEFLILEGIDNGTSKERVHATNGKGGTRTAVLNIFICPTTVRYHKDAICNDTRDFKRNPCKVSIPIIIYILNSNVGCIAIGRALDDAPKAV